MDELIAKMRSQVAKESATQGDSNKNFVKQEDSKKNSVKQEDSKKNSETLTSSIGEDNEVVIIKEITTSQSETVLKNKFKLDFEALKNRRESNSIMISEVKASDSLKIDGPLWGIVKSIETFRGPEINVYKWEICDESGVIFGSSTVNNPEISIGTIISLMNFSIWRTGNNHLNIVQRNIKKVIN